MRCVCCSVCIHVCVQVAFVHLFVCLVWRWSDTWCGCVVPPISAPSLPPLSFYRKLIGCCHWCVKLLCVGHCRQLDYLFFIFSIFEQLPSASQLFLNEILFPSVALKDPVCNRSTPSHDWMFGVLSCGVWSKMYFTTYSIWLETFQRRNTQGRKDTSWALSLQDIR